MASGRVGAVWCVWVRAARRWVRRNEVSVCVCGSLVWLVSGGRRCGWGWMGGGEVDWPVCD